MIPYGVYQPTLVNSDSTSLTVKWQSPISDGGCSVTSFALYRDNGDNGAISVQVDPANLNNKPYIFEYTITIPALTGKVVRI